MLTLGLRRRFSLTSLMALLLFFSPLFTESALAASISVSPTQGPPGTLVIVRGSGWSNGDPIKLSWNFEDSREVANVLADESGTFTTTIVVTQPTLFNIGAPIGLTTINAINGAGGVSGQAPFNVLETEPVGCADAYFIGAHGTIEGPDGPNQTLSKVIGETWENFYDIATHLGKNVKGYAIDYAAPLWTAPLDLVNVAIGKAALGDRFNKISQSCVPPSVVLVGYSLGAWVINDWLSNDWFEFGNDISWPSIRAVVLYGDPLWYRSGNDHLGQPYVYSGLARLPGLPNPYANNPQGPGVEIADRWQSRCLKGDPICGEGYRDDRDWGTQLQDGAKCPDCEHTKYTKDGGGHDLTWRGAKYLALKTFPSDSPKIEHVEIFRERNWCSSGCSSLILTTK